MTYRDDHEAAIARIGALEAELARVREDDVEQAQRIERLEEQLAAAKQKLGSTEEELEQYRPRPQPRPARRVEVVETVASASEPLSFEKPKRRHDVAIAVAVLLVVIVVVGLVLIVQSGSLDR